MPRLPLTRRIEHTMAFSVFLEPGQVLHLFDTPQLVVPNEIAFTPACKPSDGRWRIQSDYIGALMVIAASRPDVVVTVDHYGSKWQKTDHSGPWMLAGRRLLSPVVLRRSDTLDVSVRPLPGGDGDVQIHLGWVFAEAFTYARPGEWTSRSMSPPMAEIPLAWDEVPREDPPKR